MNHVCVMGDSMKAHIIAQNATQGDDDVFVSRFSVNAQQVIKLAPAYAVTTFVPRADFYVIVQDTWPTIFYFEDVADKYGVLQNVMYVVNDSMDVCMSHIQRWNMYPICAAKVSIDVGKTTMNMDLGIPTGNEGALYMKLVQKTFNGIERLRVTSFNVMCDLENFDRTAYTTLIDHG